MDASIEPMRSDRIATTPDVRDAPYEVSVVTDSSSLKPFAAELDALARSGVEDNVFYESWMLTAALDLLASDDVRIVMVRHAHDGVTGIFPFELKSQFRGLPMRALQSWRHPYCFLCTPIVSKSHAQETLRTLLAWLESGDAPAQMIELDLVAGDGPFWKLLSEEMGARRKWRARATSYERAVFEPDPGARTAVAGRHLRELRRSERRLAESGNCVYRVLGPHEPTQPWIERFLALEQSGWKGREGTALASDEASCQFFTRVATITGQRQAIQMLAIEVDGVAIAMKCNFVANDTAFAFKIAYEERFSKYSPGVLLEFFNLKNLLQERTEDVRWMDCRAVPGHYMASRLWTGRRTIATCLMANRGPALFLINHWSRLQQLRRLISKRPSSGD
jgi:CelD/BcsL family acetyltransferase involved in cellulose biosynthesis